MTVEREIDGFYVRVNPKGKSEYACKSCSDARKGQKKWRQTKAFLRSHPQTEEHLRLLDHREEQTLNTRSMHHQSEVEAAQLRTLKPLTARKVTKPLLRPVVAVDSDDELETMDDKFFLSAGGEHLQRRDTGLAVTQEDWPEDAGILPEHHAEAAGFDTPINNRAALKDLQEAAERNKGRVLQDRTDILRAGKKTDYFPYTSRTEFLLDCLDSMPRLQVSNAQMRAFIFILSECGVPDVPSLTTLRRTQARLRTEIASPTVRHASTRGNLFYVNDIGDQIAKDFANPLVRPFIHVYPELTGAGHVSEVWHAKKWTQELRPEDSTPMVIGNDKQHYYTNELAMTKNKQLVIPVRWITQEGVLAGQCWAVQELHDSTFLINREHLVHVSVSDLRYSFVRLQSLFPTQAFRFNTDVDQQIREKMPNEWRKKAEGRPVFCAQIRLWQDDVSGNISKQWNKHWVLCMTLAGIPKKLLAQEYFTHFVSCSQEATVLEQAKAIIDAINASKVNGIVTFDALLEEEIMILVNAILASSDNPMICDICSHLGLHSNKFCPRCHVGGKKEFKMSDEGYHSLFRPQEMRTPEWTIQELLKQFRLGFSGNNIQKLQTDSGVKDLNLVYWLQDQTQARSLLDTMGIAADNVPATPESKILEVINPFFSLKGFNPHIDNPVEPLHTVLLGVVKYAWVLTTGFVNKNGHNLNVLETRLRAANVDGLSIDALRASYITQYKGGLIGRQLKSILQVIVFTIHGIVSDGIRDMWVAIGNMTSLLWYTDYNDEDRYLEKVQLSIDTFLDRLAAVDESKIMTKAKCHILTHIVDDIRRFGPAITLSTETFESYNAVFRRCSIHTNHQAPSRDIGRAMSEFAAFRHIAAGGKWLEGGQWVGAGKDVMKFFVENPDFQEHLGWTDQQVPDKPQTVRKPVKDKQKYVPWRDTYAAKSIPLYASAPAEADRLNFIPCISCVADSLDIIRIDSFIVLDSELQDRQTDSPTVGRVREILEHQKDRNTSDIFIVAQKFSVGGQHGNLGMPTIHGTTEDIFILARIKNIRQLFNAQHDCQRCGCDETGLIAERQEREETGRKLSTVNHMPGDHYIVNMHSLHQPQAIRRIFDIDDYRLTSTIERIALHTKLASRLRDKSKVNNAAKRKAADGQGKDGSKKKSKASPTDLDLDEETDASDAEVPSLTLNIGARDSLGVQNVWSSWSVLTPETYGMV